MFKNKIFTVAIILVSLVTNAQIQEREFGTIEIPFNQLSTNPITVFDTQSGVTNQIDVENSVYSYLSLYINNNEPPFVWYELKATVNITPLKSNGSQDTANTFVKEIIVNYNPNYISSSGTDFNDLSFLKIENRYGLVVNLVSFTALNLANGTTVSPDNAYIKAGFRTKRFYELSQQNIIPSATPYSFSSNGNAGQAELEIQWNAIKGAIEYEVEWTWIDGYHPQNLNQLLSPGQISLSNRDFELNNTRIITKDLKYRIPLIYSKGYIIYRVRGISRFKTDSNSNYYGPWSSGEQLKEFVSYWPHYFTVNSDHENGKNWQFQASYAEEGKKKEVVSYFDGSLRNRQTVTKVNTDNNAIVGEVIYDAQGRPAIEILPTPVNEEYIHFYNNVNVNDSGVPYSHKDFDWEADNQSSEISCDIKAEEMEVSSGASKYYSQNNYFLTRKNHNFIPNANGFPFSQIEYTNDNTGRIERKGGVGESHQLGTGHEMEYLYSTPVDQKELNRLFGYSVGDISHYKKNLLKILMDKFL